MELLDRHDDPQWRDVIVERRPIQVLDPALPVR
jgi:hypothetical protein